LAVQRLLKITKKGNLKNVVYVEGAAPINLAHFRDAGFKTLFDVHPLPENHFLSEFMVTVYKIFFYFGEHTVMGLKYGSIENPIFGSKTKRMLGGVPVFLYHVPPKEALVKQLIGIESVRAIILGNNQSVNMFYLNQCE